MVSCASNAGNLGSDDYPSLYIGVSSYSDDLVLSCMGLMVSLQWLVLLMDVYWCGTLYWCDGVVDLGGHGLEHAL